MINLKEFDNILERFNFWGSMAIKASKLLLDKGKNDEFDELITTQYPEGLSMIELNDLLLIDWRYIFAQLGMSESLMLS